MISWGKTTKERGKSLLIGSGSAYRCKGDCDYFVFFDGSIYLGVVAYKKFTEQGIVFNEWHTGFVKPCRKALSMWQSSIGGIWIAIIDPKNPNQNTLRNAAQRGGFIDCTQSDNEIIYIKEY